MIGRLNFVAGYTEPGYNALVTHSEETKLWEKTTKIFDRKKTWKWNNC